MTYIVGPNTPPPMKGVAYWERTRDPSHPQAFRNLFTWIQRIMHFGVIALFRRRKHGWMGIDWTENPVAYVPDGTVADTLGSDCILDTGPVGRTCAYPKSSYAELRERHAQMLADRK